MGGVVGEVESTLQSVRFLDGVGQAREARAPERRELFCVGRLFTQSPTGAS